MRRLTTLLSIFLLTVGALATVACGGGAGEETAEAPAAEEAAEPAAEAPTEAEAPAATATEPLGSATVTGMVTYEGEIPNLKPLSMSADPACQEKHTEPVKSEVLVLGEDQKALGNVFVRVASGLPETEFQAPSEPVVIDQDGCLYKPHVVGVMAGQPLKFLNSDGILHNVHALPDENREFNMAMPAERTEATETFTKPEDMFRIKCDVHPWMNAYVRVMPHPYFDTTRESGTFTLDGLPAGTYEIEAWHEKLGTQTATVTVAEGETASVDFTFSR